jgi:hypothetical protein
MSGPDAIEVFAILQFAVMGASHLLQPQAWVEFFARLRDKGRPGVYFIAFLSLGFGSLVVAFHPVWSGVPAALTVFGWAQVVKGAVYFLFPGYALEKIVVVTPERGWMFRLWGVIFLAFALLLSWSFWS